MTITDFIKQVEGFKNKSYQDSIGKWTIGCGFVSINGHPVTANMSMTDQQICAELDRQLVPYQETVNNFVKVTLTDNQKISLTSFTYNVGITAFKNSTLLKKINMSSPIDEIGTEFMKWTKAGGVTIQGLINRRTAEYNLYKK